MIRLDLQLPRLPDSLEGAARLALEALGPELVTAAREGWPIATRASHDAFDWRIGLDGYLEVFNDAATRKGKPYVEHVHRAGTRLPAAAEAAARMASVARTRTEPLAQAIAARLKEG